MACLAHVFEEEGALDKLEAFASLNGPAFYRLPPNEGQLVLEKREEPIPVPDKVVTGDGTVTVFDPMVPVRWTVAARRS